MSSINKSVELRFSGFAEHRSTLSLIQATLLVGPMMLPGLNLIACFFVIVLLSQQVSLSSELVAEFDFQEGPDGSVIIQDPFPNAAIMLHHSGGAVSASKDHPFKDQTALVFVSEKPEKGAYVDTGINGETLSITESCSFSFWFQLADSSRADCLISIADQDAPVFSLTSWSGKLRASLYSREGEECYVSAEHITLKEQRWYHLAFVCNLESRTLLIYLNGEEVASAPLHIEPRTNAGNWIIGSDRAGSNSASIFIDLVRFYRGVLDEEEIAREAHIP